MSTTTPSDVNLNTTASALSNRMLSNTHDAIDRIASRYETITGKTHASVVYDERFWRDLQASLTEYVAERRELLSAGGYTDQAASLRDIEDFAIRTAVEEFRAVCRDDPYRIHDETTWNTFRAGLHSTGTTFNTRCNESERSEQ